MKNLIKVFIVFTLFNLFNLNAGENDPKDAKEKTQLETITILNRDQNFGIIVIAYYGKIDDKNLETICIDNDDPNKFKIRLSSPENKLPLKKIFIIPCKLNGPHCRTKFAQFERSFFDNQFTQTPNHNLTYNVEINKQGSIDKLSFEDQVCKSNEQLIHRTTNSMKVPCIFQ